MGDSTVYGKNHFPTIVKVNKSLWSSLNLLESWVIDVNDFILRTILFLLPCLPTPSIPLGSTQGRGPGHWGLWQQLWSLVSASPPRYFGSTSDDVSWGRAGQAKPLLQSLAPRPPASLLDQEKTSSRWVFSGGQGSRGEKVKGKRFRKIKCSWCSG